MSELKVNLKLYPEWVQDDIRTQLAETMEDYNRMRAELAAANAEVERLQEGAKPESGGDPQIDSSYTGTIATLRAEIAEVERLRKSLALVDDALNSYAEFYGRAAGLAGLPDDALPSTTTDEIILRKIAEHDELAAANAEIARLREIISKVEFCEEVQITEDGYMYSCPLCESTVGEGHTIACPFYQWEGTP